MKEKKRFQRIEVIVFLEALYCAVVALLNQFDMLVEIPLAVKIVMVGMSVFGIILVGNVCKRGEYFLNKGILSFALILFGIIVFDLILLFSGNK